MIRFSFQFLKFILFRNKGLHVKALVYVYVRMCACVWANICVCDFLDCRVCLVIVLMGKIKGLSFSMHLTRITGKTEARKKLCF